VRSIKIVMKKVQVVLVRLRTNFKNWNQMLLFGKRKYVEVFLMTSEEVHLCQDSKDAKIIM